MCMHILQDTVLAVLDTMKQPVEGKSDTYFLYYHILEADQDGRAPNCPTFNSSEKSCLHKIAKTDNKVMYTFCYI